jgi:hypothetical protein
MVRTVYAFHFHTYPAWLCMYNLHLRVARHPGSVVPDTRAA